MMRDLMRRYVYRFVNAHDFDEPQAIMRDDYTLHMGSDTLHGRDDEYLPAVRHQFAQFPQLEYSVHELICDGQTAAVYFSEHGGSLKVPGLAASWMGVAIYRQDGGRLAECWVEQDHYGRRAQLASGQGDPLPPVAVAPWDEPVDESDGAEGVERAFRDWVGALEAWPPASANLDAGQAEHVQPALTSIAVEVNACVATNAVVAANLTIVGTYAGGLPDCDHRVGEPVRTYAGIFANVVGGRVDGVRGVTNRVAVHRALRD